MAKVKRKAKRVKGWQHKRCKDGILVGDAPWHIGDWDPVWLTITPRRTKK